MKIITLPEEINIEKITTNLQVFDYHNSQKIIKQQIILNQNAFSFLIEGTKEVISENSSLSIDNSKFLLMKSGHCLMTEKLSDFKSYRSILFFFTNEILFEFVQKAKLNSDLSADTSVCAFQYDGFIKRFVASLLDVSKLSNNAKSKLLKVKFEEIMQYLIEIHGTQFLFSLMKNSDNYTQKFIRTIETNKLNKLKLKELAFLCDRSESTFKREFEKHYNESPIKWFQNARLEHAKYLLNQERKSSSEIYLEVGYENLSSFIQAYKLKYGFTPKQHNK